MAKQVKYATFSTWVTPTVAITRGECWDANDPVVLSHPDWFTDDPSEFARTSSSETYTSENATSGIEQATAAPGEKRSVAPPATRAGKAKSE